MKPRAGGGSTPSRRDYQKDAFGKKITVEGAFDSFVESYDNVMGKPMTFSAVMLIRDLQIPENPTVLDIGCGTGISTFEIMKKAQGKGKFYGIDVSQKMIDLARAKAAKLGYGNVDFIKGDAERLEFPESSFDVVLSNQVFQFLTNKQKAIDEIFRVLKPMGQTALVFFGEPTGKEIYEIYERIRSRHTEYCLPEHLKLIGTKETHELFDRAGFKNTRISPTQMIDYANPSGYTIHVDAPPTKINLPSELAEVVGKEIKKEMARTKTEKGFRVTVCIISAYAQKV
jgi:ubiquinone/menaquinone biosynthesis C-methylase UbiE